MSEIYVRRLARVVREFDAACEALDYVQQNWQRQSVFLYVSRSGLPDLARAADNLESVYLLRLFSTFEGLLKEHLAEHHPGITVPEDARAVWLVDRAAQRQTPPISAALRNRVHDVRRYRNHLTHPSGVPFPAIAIATALARLSRFADRLPEPR